MKKLTNEDMSGGGTTRIILDDNFGSERLSFKYNLSRFFNLVVHFIEQLPELATLLEEEEELLLESMKKSARPFLPERYKNDIIFLRKACKMNCNLIQNFDLMQNDKECCLTVALQTGNSMLHLCKIKDVDVLLAAFKTSKDVGLLYGSVLSGTEEYKEWKKIQNEQKNNIITTQTMEIWDEKQVALNSVSKNGMNLRKFPSFAFDKDVVLAAIKQNGTVFQIIDEKKWKEDFEIVSAAIDSDPLNLKFLSENFKQDKTLVLKAVTKNGFALKFAGSLFQSDKQIVLSSFTSNGKAVEFVHKSLWNDEEVMRRASRKTGRCLYYANDSIKSNRELALQIIHQFPEGFSYLSKLKTDRDFVLSAIEKNHIIFHHTDLKWRQDNSFLIDALKRNSLIFPYLPAILQQDPNTIILSCKNSLQYLQDFLYNKDSFKDDFDFAFKCIEVNGSALSSFTCFSPKNSKLLAIHAAKYFFHQRHPNFKLLLPNNNNDDENMDENRT